MFGQSNDSITYLFSKLLFEPTEEPSVIPVDIQHDMVVTPRFQIEHGPDDIPPKVQAEQKGLEIIAPAIEVYG